MPSSIIQQCQHSGTHKVSSWASLMVFSMNFIWMALLVSVEVGGSVGSVELSISAYEKEQLAA